ncbi:MAG: HAMP domain-containing sensor histidine kinase [Blastocatellia bacterium]
MTRLQTFLNRHLLTLGVVAVSASLLAILMLQYRSLVALETALPVYNREQMKNALRQVAEDIESDYRQRVATALRVPAKAIQTDANGLIVLHGDWEATSNRARLLAMVADVAEHFRPAEQRGVRRFFIVAMAQFDGMAFGKIAFVYDPATQRMKSAADTPEFNAIHSAAAPLMPEVRSHQPTTPQLVSSGHGEYRILTQTILDEAQQMIGVAGMVVDQDWLRQEYLPAALRRALPKLLPTEYQQAVVTITDGRGQMLYSTQPGVTAQAEAQLPFSFLQPDWRLGLRLRQVTEEQWSRRNFYLTLVLWVLMTGMLAGGLWLALRAAAREVKLSQMKADFVSNVSHELRTPLASIRVFGEFLKLGLPEDARTVQQYGEYIESESRRLTGLINNILDFSRIESGQKAYSFELADVQELLSEMLRTFSLRLKQSDFVLRLETPALPLPPLLVDTDALTQAFLNLLDNAVKYSGQGREIVVTLTRQHQWATIAVSDDGIGIPDEEQAKIFARFHRVSRGLVHDVKGTGLGLSIVKHIVEAHQGRITVASRVGHGSTFTIYLPLEESKPGL